MGDTITEVFLKRENERLGYKIGVLQKDLDYYKMMYDILLTKIRESLEGH